MLTRIHFQKGQAGRSEDLPASSSLGLSGRLNHLSHQPPRGPFQNDSSSGIAPLELWLSAENTRKELLEACEVLVALANCQD
jgi:hypothetical protein